LNCHPRNSLKKKKKKKKKSPWTPPAGLQGVLEAFLYDSTSRAGDVPFSGTDGGGEYVSGSHLSA